MRLLIIIMKNSIFVLVILALFVFSIPVLAVDMSACGEITEDVVITVDIVHNPSDTYDPCFDITADGVTIDCQWHTISSSNNGDGIGLMEQLGTQGTTIQNCIITNFKRGIESYGSQTTLANIIANSNGFGINFERSNQHILTNITANLNGEGIVLNDGSGSTLTDIITNSNRVGISIFSSSHTFNNIVANSNTEIGISINIGASDNQFLDVEANFNGNAGIYLKGSSSNELSDVTVNSNGIGIHFTEVIGGLPPTNNIFSDVTADSNTYGVKMDYDNFPGYDVTSPDANNELNSVSISNSDFNFYIRGSADGHYINSIDTSNTVDSKEIYYLVGSSDEVINADNIGYIACINCNDIIFEDIQDLTKNSEGVLFYNTHDSTIRGVSAYSNDVGLNFIKSFDNNIQNNIIESNEYGIYAKDSDDNVFYHNSFIDNTNQIYESTSDDNTWYNKELFQGNYWSDYTGEDDGSGVGRYSIAGDGIGDTEIPHPGDGYDMAVLMEQWSGSLPESVWCESDGDCEEGICVLNRCVECAEDDDCEEGEECVNRKCEEKYTEEREATVETGVLSEETREVKEFIDILAGEPVKMEVTKDLSVSEMLVEVGKDLDTVKVGIEEFPPTVYDNKLETKVYKYLKITSSESIVLSEAKFKVSNSWMADEGLTADDMALFHYDQGKRKELDTEIVSKDGVYTYFESTTKSFSLFEIGEKGEEKEVLVDYDEELFTGDPEFEEILEPGATVDNTTAIMLITATIVLLYVIYKLWIYIQGMNKSVKRKK